MGKRDPYAFGLGKRFSMMSGGGDYLSQVELVKSMQEKLLRSLN